MKTPSLSLWWLRCATFGLAALAGASGVYWGLKVVAPAPVRGAAAPLPSAAPASDPQRVARALGGVPAAAVAAVEPSVASRFKLIGVVVEGAQAGLALMTVDGKPPKPFRVGSVVSDGLVLHSVQPRSAALSVNLNTPASVTLELPKAPGR